MKEEKIMAYYCGECAVWQGSSSENKYGERYCGYSGRYESSDQNTYGCRGFVYTGRVIVTQTCRMLGVNPKAYFAAFDAAKEKFVIPTNTKWLVRYCQIGPQIAAKMAGDQEGRGVAEGIMARYIDPAREMCENGDYEGATVLYRDMVRMLGRKYQLAA